jgi:predicted transcriptional regulator
MKNYLVTVVSYGIVLTNQKKVNAMTSHRRDRLEIMEDILILCMKQDMKKNKISNKSNLNFQKASEYIEWLKYHNLIQEEKKGIYKITTAGEALLHNLEKLDVRPSESEK